MPKRKPPHDRKTPERLVRHLMTTPPWLIDLDALAAFTGLPTGGGKPGWVKGMSLTGRRAWARDMQEARRKARKKKRAAEVREIIRRQRDPRAARAFRHGRPRGKALLPGSIASRVLCAMQEGVWYARADLAAALSVEQHSAGVKILQELLPRGFVERGLNADRDEARAARGLTAGNARYLWRITPAGLEARRELEIFD